MVRTKKYDKKSSKKKLSEFTMSDRKGSVNNIPSAEKKCVKEKSKEVLGKRVLDNNNLKDSKPQSNHNITSSLFHLLTEDLDLFGEIAPLHVAAHFGASDDSEDKESDESEKKPTVKKRRRSYVEVKNAIQVKMFLKPLVQEKDTFTEQGENEIGFDSHESENNIQVEHFCSLV